MKDANDVAASVGVLDFQSKVASLSNQADDISARDLGWYSVSGLYDKHKGDLRRPIINGLLRRGETMNIIAPPKVGKSWMAYGLALSIVSGRSWIKDEWSTTQGSVAIIDNELHEETLSHRISYVREKMGMSSDYENNIFVCSLRGKDKNMNDMSSVMTFLIDKQPQIVIMDSLYRLIPPGVSENDNGAMMQIYNEIDRLGVQMGGSGIVLIHHASKGGQGEKNVTDVGSGAGSQSRAVDTHLVIREHEVESYFVLEGRCRTWIQPKPTVLEWDYPLWNVNIDEDPDKLKGKKEQKEKMDTLDGIRDEDFCKFLNPDIWYSKKQVMNNIRKVYNVSFRTADTVFEDVIARHGLSLLSATDGIKDLGLFKAAIRRGGGVYFYKD